ncbi:MAG: hypothetical protein NVSMB18_17010 [Acetobacteraceae bacterium]
MIEHHARHGIGNWVALLAFMALAIAPTTSGRIRPALDATPTEQAAAPDVEAQCRIRPPAEANGTWAEADLLAVLDQDVIDALCSPMGGKGPG